MPVLSNPNDTVEVPDIMRAFDPEVVDAVWAAVEPLLPGPRVDEHPLGCHRPRVPDRVCFEGGSAAGLVVILCARRGRASDRCSEN